MSTLKRFLARGKVVGTRNLGSFMAASAEGARELALASEAARAPLCFRCRCGAEPTAVVAVDVEVEPAPEEVEGSW